MRRILTLLTVLGLAVISTAMPLRARPAHALDFWCWDDPIFEVAGQRVAVNIGIRKENLPSLQNVEVVLTVPEGVDARTVFVDTTWYTPAVRIVHDGRRHGNGAIEVGVDVSVRARDAFSYQIVVVKPRGNRPDEDKFVVLSNRKHNMQFKLKAK